MKRHKKAPSGMKGKDYDSDSAKKPRVIKKPLSSRQKRSETSADPNKAPTDDSIVMIEEKISSKKPFENYVDNIWAATPEYNCDLYPSNKIDNHSPIKKIKGNEPILRSNPTKNLEDDSDPSEQSKHSDSSGDHDLGTRKLGKLNKKLPSRAEDFVDIVGVQRKNILPRSAENTTRYVYRNRLENSGSSMNHDKFLAKRESSSENEVDF